LSAALLSLGQSQDDRVGSLLCERQEIDAAAVNPFQGKTGREE
jgi:hypothetical protein